MQDIQLGYDPRLVGGENTITSIDFDANEDLVLIKWVINGVDYGRYYPKVMLLKATLEYINNHGKVLNPVI